MSLDIIRELTTQGVICDLSDLSINDQHDILVRATIHGHINILCAYDMWEPILFTRISKVSTIHGHLHILCWIMETTGFRMFWESCKPTVLMQAVKYERIAILDWMYVKIKEHSAIEPSRYLWICAYYAVWFGKHRVLEWIQTEEDIMFKSDLECCGGVSTKDRMFVQVVLHRGNFRNLNRKACANGTCKVCSAEKVWDLWEMDISEFTTSTQWLPRELIDDVLTLYLGI